MKNIILYIIGGLVVLGIIVLAIRSSRPEAVANTATNASNVGQNTPQIQAAPSFSLAKLGGGTITLAEYKGKKSVVLDFWTTWCPNCKRDMPKLNSWYQKYKDKVEVIGIDMQEDPSLVAKTIADRGISFPIALDTSGSVTQTYGIGYTNVHVLVDKNGNVVRAIPGDISESDITSLFN